MAIVNIEGTVSRLNNTGNGFGVKETREHQGKTYTTYWSVFPPNGEARTVLEGDRVKVNGFLRTEVSKRDPRYVDHTVGQARVEVVGGAPVAAPVVEPAAEPWGAAVTYPAETPF